MMLFFQSSPQFRDGFVLTADKLNAAFSGKLDVSTGVWLIIAVWVSLLIGLYLNRRFPK